MGVCVSNWALSLNDLHNAISETSGRPYAHSSKSDREFGDSHSCVVQYLCQGVLVQCRVAHRYPPGGSFPILNCVTYVMLVRWNGRSASIWAFSLNHVRNALFETFGRPYDHSSKSDRGFGDSHPCVVRCLCQGVLVQCRVAHRYPPGGSFPIINCVT